MSEKMRLNPEAKEMLDEYLEKRWSTLIRWNAAIVGAFLLANGFALYGAFNSAVEKAVTVALTESKSVQDSYSELEKNVQASSMRAQESIAYVGFTSTNALRQLDIVRSNTVDLAAMQKKQSSDFGAVQAAAEEVLRDIQNQTDELKGTQEDLLKMAETIEAMSNPGALDRLKSLLDAVSSDWQFVDQVLEGLRLLEARSTVNRSDLEALIRQYERLVERLHSILNSPPHSARTSHPPDLRGYSIDSGGARATTDWESRVIKYPRGGNEKRPVSR